MKLRSMARLIGAGALVVLAFAGCGGSDDESTSVRFLNATVGVGDLDFYVGDTRIGSAIAPDGTTNYADVEEGSHDFKLKRPGTDTSILSTSVTLSTGERYTTVAWGRDGAVKLSHLIEDEDTPSSGQSKVRLFNAAPDSGAVDLYISESSAALDNLSATASNIGSGSLSGYTQFGKGSYRLRVTGTSNKDDVRLDVDGIVLGDQERVTVILQPTTGGVLVNAVLLVQQGGLRTAKTTQARMRVVASVSSNGVVAASIGATSLASASTSPAVGSYALVPSGDQALLAQVNGTTVGGSTVSVAAGGDYTVLVYGSPAAPQLKLVTDDNRLPSNSSKAKMRLINGAEGSDNLSLTLDAVAVVDSVGVGNASSYYTVTPNSGNALIEVSSPLSNTPLYTTAKSSGSTGVSIDAQGVYTVFMLGGNASPRGVLRKER